MDNFLEWFILHGMEVLGCGLGLIGVIILLSVEHDLKILQIELSSTNQNLNKLTYSLMNSLNDVRKLIHKHRPTRNNQDKKKDV